MAEPWNINIHYDGKLDRCVPPEAGSVLEVGCGDGFLAARLSQRIPTVVAVDIDQPVPGTSQATVSQRAGEVAVR
jgi:protein-L-isoaspartate O-methyltransferase